MELEKFESNDLSPVMAEIVGNLRTVLDGTDNKAKYYNELLDKPVNQDFAAGLLESLSQRQDLNWDLYALRSTELLTYPDSKGTRIVAGLTTYYSFDYERYRQPTKEILQSSFELAGHTCSATNDRGFIVKGLMRKNIYGLLETYYIIVFNQAPSLVQR